jgi:hypothetical protein
MWLGVVRTYNLWLDFSMHVLVTYCMANCMGLVQPNYALEADAVGQLTGFLWC